MLSEEILFYEHIKTVLNKFRKEILENLMLKNLPNITLEEIKSVKKDDEKKLENNLQTIRLLRILEPVPQFVGDDLIIYGPFEAEDVASLPFNISDVLIKKSKAEEIKA